MDPIHVIVFTLLFSYKVNARYNKMCLVPNKLLSPWSFITVEDIICPTEEIKIPESSIKISKDIALLDTKDVFTSRKISMTSSKYI